MEAITWLAMLLSVPTTEPAEAVDAVLSRFPEPKWEYVVLARTHIAWIENEVAVYPLRRADFELWSVEARRCERAWQLLHDANHCCASAWPHLDDLRCLLGDEAFFAGRMPPPLPVWWFTEIDR